MIKVLGSMDFEPFVETIENLPTDSSKKLLTGWGVKNCEKVAGVLNGDPLKWMVPKETNQSIETIWPGRPLKTYQLREMLGQKLSSKL